MREGYRRITATEAGRMLGMSRQEVAKRIKSGILPIGTVKYNAERPSYTIYYEWVVEYMEGHHGYRYSN